MSPSRRSEGWAATMHGHPGEHVRRAHRDSAAKVGVTDPVVRGQREQAEDAWLAPGATRARGAGRRRREEAPDEHRTCFERDRDRILHGTTAFRRLAGKTQVFVFPEDHQRTRLTHALEVAQVGTSIARACRLNVALVEAIALGHDCGHGPGGHASEDAFSPYIPGGYDHAVWGADTVLAPLNLCAETLDGVRNHSWSRPAPATPEGEVVSWADRIAYVCHDFEDATRAGIVTSAMLPGSVRQRCGRERRHQLDAFIRGVVDATCAGGEVGMVEELADALADFRSFNYEAIYMRPASVAQGESVIQVLRALVDYYADRPNALVLPGLEVSGGQEPERDYERGRRSGTPPATAGLAAGSEGAVREAVTYVAGMTDRYAFSMAVSRLGWDPSRLPQGVGLTR